MTQVHPISMLLWACSGLSPTTSSSHSENREVYWGPLSRILPSHFLKPQPCFCNLVKKTSKCKMYLFSPLPYGFNFPLEIENNTERLKDRRERREPVAAEQDCDSHPAPPEGAGITFPWLWILQILSPNSPIVAKSRAKAMSNLFSQNAGMSLTL